MSGALSPQSQITTPPTTLDLKHPASAPPTPPASDMDSDANSDDDNTIPAPTSSPSPPSYAHLPLELRHKILTHLLFSLLDDTLRTWAASPLFPTANLLPAAATVVTSGSTSASALPNPLLDNLRALSLTSHGLRDSLVDPLRALSAHLLERWHRLLCDAHARLYEHVSERVQAGVLGGRGNAGQGREQEGRGMVTLEWALRTKSWELNEYYQQVATRVLYEPEGRSGGGGMLGKVARGWEGVVRVAWALEGKSEEDFLDWYDQVFNQRLTIRQVHQMTMRKKEGRRLSDKGLPPRVEFT